MSVDKPTLGALFQITARDRWKGTKGESTAICNAIDVIETIGGMDVTLGSITWETTQALCNNLEKRGLSKATINRKLSALSLMLSVASKRGLMDKVPTLEFYKEHQKEIYVIDAEREGQITKALCIHRPQFLQFIYFMIDTGFRLSEAINLEARGYNSYLKTVTIWDTKNGQPRTIPLTARANLVFNEFLRQDAIRPFSCLTVDSIQKNWAHLRKELNLCSVPSFTPHVMRHTCASRLVNGGADILIVKEWLGHKSLSTTMRYMHLNPKRLLAAVSILEG